MVGDFGSIISGAEAAAVGIVAFGAGIISGGTGTALLETGIGEIPFYAVGAGAIAVGVPIAAYGLDIINHSRSNLNDDLMMYNKAGNGNNGTSNIPWIRDNRVPLDRETVLSGSDYKKTNIDKVKGAQVYKKGDYYYHRDTFHKGEGSHMEVYDKSGNHVGEADPLTGEMIPNTKDPNKKINVK